MCDAYAQLSQQDGESLGEEIVPLPHWQVSADQYHLKRVRVFTGGAFYDGVAKDIHRGVVSGDRLYMIRYDDGILGAAGDGERRARVGLDGLLAHSNR